MTKIAHLDRKNEQDNSVPERSDKPLTRVMRATAKAGADVAGETAQLAQTAADVTEGVYQTTRTLAETSPEVGQAFAELLAEQTRQNMETVSAFARAVNWTEVLEAQSRLMAGSLQRLSQFNARYREVFLRGMTAVARSSRP